jgi:hypothetical protein
MVRFNARMLGLALFALIVACAEPHQPGPPPPAQSQPPPPPPAPPVAPAQPAAPRDSGSFTWQSGPIAAP